MAVKKEKKCSDCKHLIKKECTHTSNKGLKIQYRYETPFFVKTPEELNTKGDCTNYEKA